MMDYTDSNILSAMTDEEITHVLKALNDELNYRKRKREANLIESFHRAWSALRDAGINVSYADGDEDRELVLWSWDGFNFS
jgi:hypothetical protein